LVEVALEAGAKAAYRVDDYTEIDDSWFEGVETVGVTSGASVPEDLVSDVLDYLAKRQFDDVRTVTTAEEDVQFSLPKELRKDLKAAGEDTSNKKRD
jgi:4-hydroxy-3-methylbut-2-enyl diphosphate reductase